jgi:cob(I)alamin adenosyltransferase
MTAKGCVQIYSGDGKGKTTAAAGLALRAVGAGMRVFIGQFIKAGASGEMRVLRERCPEVTVEQFGSGRFIKGKPAPGDIADAARGVARLRQVLASGDYDVVIADEAHGAVSAGLITAGDLLGLLDVRPEPVELVLTGRNPDPRLVARADLVTDMKAVKHPFEDGVPARKGIEY